MQTEKTLDALKNNMSKKTTMHKKTLNAFKNNMGKLSELPWALHALEHDSSLHQTCSAHLLFGFYSPLRSCL